ncbi:MAG: glycine betaine ABC transporter substrate-binding protein [Thermodesulfobacteriota bacterium]
MTRRCLLLAGIAGLAVLLTGQAWACVGRFLFVGTVDTPQGRVLAELVAQLINERTGTTVKIRFFDDRAKLYQALRSANEEERADILVEDTASAMAMLKQERLPEANAEYLAAKEAYEKELGLVWLNPFGFRSAQEGGPTTVSAPVLRQDVLANFPLLPRVLNKLAGAIDDAAFAGLVGEVQSGNKPNNVARDWLRAKKLI